MNMFYIVTLIYCVSGREKRLPVMAASSVPPFPWTDRMIGQALTYMLEVVRGGLDDPLDKENIRQAVTICRSTSTSSQIKHYKVALQYYKYDTHVVPIRFQSNG